MVSFFIGGGEDVQPSVELEEMESVEVEEEFSERETRRLRREQEKEVKRLQREANLRRKVIGNGTVFLSVEGSSDAGMFSSSALCNEKNNIFLATWISWALLDCCWLVDWLIGWSFHGIKSKKEYFERVSQNNLFPPFYSDVVDKFEWRRKVYQPRVLRQRGASRAAKPSTTQPPPASPSPTKRRGRKNAASMAATTAAAIIVDSLAAAVTEESDEPVVLVGEFGPIVYDSGAIVVDDPVAPSEERDEENDTGTGESSDDDEDDAGSSEESEWREGTKKRKGLQRSRRCNQSLYHQGIDPYHHNQTVNQSLNVTYQSINRTVGQLNKHINQWIDG